MYLTKLCPCVLVQKAAWYLRRHRQEVELLLIGSDIMGSQFTEGVSLHHVDYLSANPWARHLNEPNLHSLCKTFWMNRSLKGQSL